MRRILLHPAVSFIIIPFLAAYLIAQPLRTGFRDDDFAVARTTEQLFQTGVYRQDNWLAPNMLAQAIWGSGFMTLFGDRHESLYLANAALYLLSGLGMYALAREYGLTPTASGLVGLTLIGIQPVVFGGFSFMTDVPALTAAVFAALLLTRGLRLGSLRWMVIASAALAISLLTRQTNAALFVGLIGVAALDLLRSDRRRWRLYAAALPLPLAALVWQALALVTADSWAIRLVAFEQREYFTGLIADPVVGIATGIGRVGLVVSYLGSFALPWIFVGFSGLKRRHWLWLVIVLIDIIAATAVFALITHRAIWMPLLSLPLRWSDAAAWVGVGLIGLVSASLVIYQIVIRRSALWIGIGVGIALFALLLSQTLPSALPIPSTEIVVTWVSSGVTWLCASLVTMLMINRWLSPLPAYLRLLDISALVLLGISLSTYQLFDRYFLPFVPYTLIVAGAAFDRLTHRRTVSSAIIFTIALSSLLVNSAIVNRSLNEMEMNWGRSCYWPYMGYIGAFDAYAASHDPTEGMLGYFHTMLPSC